MKIVKIKKIEKIENSSLRYDIEVKNTHNFFANNILVHNSNSQCVWLSPTISDEIKTKVNIDEWIKVIEDNNFLGYVAVASKGLGSQGLFFKDNEANSNNVYLKAIRPHFYSFAKFCLSMGLETCVMLGEVFGSNIQKGFDYGQTRNILNVFDVYIGYRGRGTYVDDEVLDAICLFTHVQRVPLVYRGPFSFAIMDKLANDKETEFNCKHVREGVIVKPVVERFDPKLGRVALKHRSVAYLMKCSGEEVQ